MIAYKFLAPGSIGPFTGFHWPVPGPSGPGPWVTEPPHDDGAPHRGVHACRLDDLPYWLDEELWTVELDGPIHETPTQIVAPRGRLLQRIVGWTREAALDLGAAAAWRIRDRAADAFAAAGHTAQAEALRALADLVDLRRAAAEIGASAPSAPHAARRLAEYAGDAAGDTLGGSVATSLYQATAAAAVLFAGAPDAVPAERRWQAAFLAKRCGLPAG